MQDVSFPQRGLPGALVRLLPRAAVNDIAAMELEGIEELRLYANRYAVLYKDGRCHSTRLILSQKEMDELLFRMCGGSVYAHANTIRQGFLSFGGMRVGLCGHAALSGNDIQGVHRINSMVIRFQNPTHVSTLPLLEIIMKERESLLVFSPPGVGKTTLLRAAARQAALPATGLRVAVIDCRGEFEAALEDPMLNLCLLSGYPKEKALRMALCTLSPDLIICDEIGSPQDADAILEGANGGVPILCSAHGGEIGALLQRPQIRRLHDARIFGSYARLSRDKNGCAAFSIYRYEEAEDAAKRWRP